MTGADRRFAFSQTRPVLLELVLLLVVLITQVVDEFVLELANVPEPLIVSRVPGILVLLGYLWLLRRPLSAVGLHRENAASAFVITSHAPGTELKRAHVASLVCARTRHGRP